MPTVNKLPKPQLAASGKPLVIPDNESLVLGFDKSQRIVQVAEESWLSVIGRWIRTTFLTSLFMIGIGATLYTIASATLFFGTIVENQIMMVARGTFIGGVPETGSFVLVSQTTPAPEDFINKTLTGFTGVTDAVAGEVLALPFYTVEVTPQGVLISPLEGRPISLPVGIVYDADLRIIAGPTTLGDEILVSCLIAAPENCTQGEYYIVSIDKLYGEVKI